MNSIKLKVSTFVTDVLNKVYTYALSNFVVYTAFVLIAGMVLGLISASTLGS